MHSQILYKQIVIQSCFFPQQLWWEGWLNTIQYTRFSCIYEKCLKDCRLLYAGDRSLYRRAFQNNLSSILHYLRHTLTILSSISRATGKIFAMWCRHWKLVSKIPILPCSLGLWAFCFSFDNVFWNSCVSYSPNGIFNLRFFVVSSSLLRKIKRTAQFRPCLERMEECGWQNGDETEISNAALA